VTRRKDFAIDGEASEVVQEISRLFNQEKMRSRSKAMDNLQSRLFANGETLIKAGYLNFRELLGEIADLEKSIVERKGGDAPTMDKIEEFMQQLEGGSIEDSAPLTPKHEPAMGDFDLEDEIETEEEADGIPSL